MLYFQREIETKVKEYLSLFPAIAITGARQVGKSTMLQYLFKNYTYISFDDYQVLEFFHADPEGFIKKYNNHVIFDEVQKAPEIFNYIKIAIDNDRENYGKFILTGSSQFAFIKNMSESLAGRIGLLSLMPFEYSEIPSNIRQKALYQGSYPELVKREYKGSMEWYASYLGTYLSKDLRELINIGDLRDFQRLLKLLAINTSQTLNMSQFAKDIGITVQTVKRWISALEASYLIFLLPPYHNNMGKRIIKSPKIYFIDTGLASFLADIDLNYPPKTSPMSGPLFENYVISEIMKKELNRKTHAKLYYLRTSNGDEVDLIIDRKTHKDFIEIKHGASFKAKMFDAIKLFKEEGDHAYLLYQGKKVPFSDEFSIMNYADYLLNPNIS